MYKYFDPKILSKIKKMSLRAKLVVDGFLVGIHRSPYHGFSVEFSEHRQYQPGDELKRIDWKVYARRERFYTKEFEQETNVRAYIILDGSNSMNYVSNGLTKFSYASYLAASLSWLLIHQRDAVSLTIFDERIRKFLPPLATRLHLYNIMNLLEDTQPSMGTKILPVFDEIFGRIKIISGGRGIIIILSDLLLPQYEFINKIKILRAIGNEVIIFHILAPEEIDLPCNKPIIFKDMETEEEIPITPDIKISYKKKVQEFIDYYKKNFFSNNVDYALFTTNDTLDKALVFYLAMRSKYRPRR